VAVIGDSNLRAFGISNLVNAAYNNRRGLFIVLDNNTTAMTACSQSFQANASIWKRPLPLITGRSALAVA